MQPPLYGRVFTSDHQCLTIGMRGGGVAGLKRIKGYLFAHDIYIIVQELCESRGGRPGLSVLTSLLVSVDVRLY